MVRINGTTTDQYIYRTQYMEKLIGSTFSMGFINLLLAQGGAWFQHNLQFKYTEYGPTWWGWYVSSIPLTWLFLTGTKYTAEGFDGSVWIQSDLLDLQLV